MNNIIANAFERKPGNYHFTLLRLPSHLLEQPEIPEQELMKEEQQFLELGVQPICFREFEDIQNLILMPA